MFKILVKFSQELKSTGIGLFKNTNAPPAFQKIRKLDMNFVDFQRDDMILWKMKNAQMKQRGSQPESQQFVYTWTAGPFSFTFYLIVPIFTNLISYH